MTEQRKNLAYLDFTLSTPRNPNSSPLMHSGSMTILQYSSTRALLRRIDVRTQQPFSKGTQRRKTSVVAKKTPENPQPLKPEEHKPDAVAVPVPATPAAKVPLLQRLGPLTKVAHAYDRVQKRRPWTTQLCASLFVYFFGDQLAQYIDGERYDPLRTLRHLTIGAGASIPGYTWYPMPNT